jgi:hypothetical protein
VARCSLVSELPSVWMTSGSAMESPTVIRGFSESKGS